MQACFACLIHLLYLLQAFYDAADRLGIMVYQETMHSQAMPVRDVNFGNERLEVEDMINQISSHPSVVRYGWGNEYLLRNQ